MGDTVSDFLLKRLSAWGVKRLYGYPGDGITGNPKLETTQDLPDFPYARYADSIGLKGVRVDRPEDVGRAWDEALSADRPVIFEAYTSGDVPTLPPYISFEEAKHYTSALLKGDPEEEGIIKESVKGVLDAVLPHKD
jgi:pyruvate dehydrogenase (quinone)